MANGLKLTHEELGRQVAIRTEQLEEAFSVARAADAGKRRLIACGNALVEEERRRILLEIHDDLNALLVAIRLQAGTLASSIRESEQTQLLEAVERITALIDTVYERSRDIVQRLRPEIIDTLGLSGAIEEMVRHLDEADPSCAFKFVVEQPLPAMPDAMAIAAYRVVQEALSNVVKHAGASTCVVKVDRANEPSGVRVTVRDDGCGFDTAAMHAGLGLVGMRERVTALNGSLTIDAEPGRGTVVRMTLPLPLPLKGSPP